MFCKVTIGSHEIFSNNGLVNYVINASSCGLVLPPEPTLQSKMFKRLNEDQLGQHFRGTQWLDGTNSDVKKINYVIMQKLLLKRHFYGDFHSTFFSACKTPIKRWCRYKIALMSL